MIEHRHTKRVAVTKKISIYHRGMLVADCKIKDISYDGMALWTGPLQYHRNTMLEVEFNPTNSEPQDKIRVPAIVVYSAAKVLGLMFTHVNDAAQQTLRQIVNNEVGVNSSQDRLGQSWEKSVSTQAV